MKNTSKPARTTRPFHASSGKAGIPRCSSGDASRGAWPLIAEGDEVVTCKRCLAMRAPVAAPVEPTAEEREAAIVAEVEAYRARLIALGRTHLVSKR